MREITEKHIIEMIKNHDKWRGSNGKVKQSWKGAQSGKRMVGASYKGINRKV